MITIMAIGQGGRAMLMQEMDKFGVNLLVVYVSYQDGEGLRVVDLQASDAILIKPSVPEMEHFASLSFNRMELRSSRGSRSVQVIGTTADLADERYSLGSNILLQKLYSPFKPFIKY